MSYEEASVNAPPPGRGTFCNRTLNLRSIRAIGYDMDYTLIHYRVEDWERHAYEHIKHKLVDVGWPVEDLEFDPELIIRGLIVDAELGNILKANRFGYVKRAFHGTEPLSFEDQRRIYSRTVIDLAEERYRFINTLFSLSEGCIYAQLVNLLDQRRLPEVLGYADLSKRVQECSDQAHVEGILKAEIMANPDRFVELDPDTPLALLDQRHTGKKLLLVTNSEWGYTSSLMSYAFDRFLPKGSTWRDLFDIIIVSARKPDFFAAQGALFEVANEDGLLRPVMKGMREGGIYAGGSAALVEQCFALSGDEILYVGDHIFSDVHISKSMLRWRTALVVRELESELAAIEKFNIQEQMLSDLMEQKECMELEHSQLRLQLQRKRSRYGPKSEMSRQSIVERISEVRGKIAELDREISPLAAAASEVSNARWGLLMRAGNDKSHLADQVERWADIYMSRVSNFLFQTPYVYLRSPRGTMPHDAGHLPASAVPQHE